MKTDFDTYSLKQLQEEGIKCEKLSRIQKAVIYLKYNFYSKN